MNIHTAAYISTDIRTTFSYNVVLVYDIDTTIPTHWLGSPRIRPATP